MSKRALSIMAMLLAFGGLLFAEENGGAEQTESADFTIGQAAADGVVEAPAATGGSRLFGTLHSAWYGPSSLTLADQRLFSFPSAFAWTEAAPVDFLPAATLAEPPRGTARTAATTREAASRPVDLLPKFDYAHGEVGLFYGKSTGGSGREVKAAYLLSEIVEGNTHISVGVSYEESNGRGPRLGR